MHGVDFICCIFSRLSDVVLEHAIPASPTSSGLPALGVEECVCTEEYSGLSCQVS